MTNEQMARHRLGWARQRTETYLGLKYEDHLPDMIKESLSTERTPETLNRFAELTDVEAAHVVTYTQSSFYDLNRGLRSGELAPELREHAEVLRGALEKLPKFEGKVVRGAELSDDVIENYRGAIGKTVVERGFLSTTSDGRQRFKGNTRFVIKSKTGRDVGMLSHALRQREVLFGAGTSFKIVSVGPGSGRYKHQVTLEEV